MANWAQMVNILAPIMTNPQTSVKQTVFFPLKEYRKQSLKESVQAKAQSLIIEEGLQSINVSATVDRDKKQMTVNIVNINPQSLKTKIRFSGCKVGKLLKTTIMTATSLDAKNKLDTPDKNVVQTKYTDINKKIEEIKLQGESITICQFELSDI